MGPTAAHAPQPGNEDLLAAAHRPDMTPVPDQNTSGPAHAGHAGRGNSTSRPAATYASTGSGHGHTMATGDTASDPFSRSAQNEARRDPSRSRETPKSWPAQGQPDSNISKEHGRAPAQDAQKVRPSTTASNGPRGTGDDERHASPSLSAPPNPRQLIRHPDHADHPRPSAGQQSCSAQFRPHGSAAKRRMFSCMPSHGSTSTRVRVSCCTSVLYSCCTRGPDPATSLAGA